MNNNEIEIPITIKSYEGYTITYKKYKADKIRFIPPSSERNRLIEIGGFEVNDYDNNSKFIKQGQKIVLEPPFYFKKDDRKINMVEIEANKKYTVFISINDINELQNIPNINEDYKFTFQWKESSDTPQKEEIKSANSEQAIKPYVEPIQDFDFKPKSFCSEDPNPEKKNHYKINCDSEDCNGIRYNIGKIIIRNLQTIPYQSQTGEYNGIKLSNLKIGLVKKGKYIGYIRNNNSYTNIINVQINNGADEKTFDVYLDWQKWKNLNKPTSFNLIICNSANNVLFKCFFRLVINYYTNVYSLDLGTSGIVVAKQTIDGIEVIKLQDQEVSNLRIEQNDNILSSISILKIKEKKIELAPSKTDIQDEDVNILVPTKFIVGQNHIPFLECNDNLQSIDAYNQGKLDLSKINETNIQELISKLYQDIFKRFREESHSINKIIVTYPNTYTIDIIRNLRKILKDNLKLDSSEQIDFVPESDAVAAFYFDQRIYSNGFPLEKENIIIYDMGAGTLDLSLVEFIKANNQCKYHTARIVNKIGLPIAGNYLDYIIYKGLKKHIKSEVKNYKGQLYLKDAVSDFKKSIPEIIEEDKKIGKLTGKLGAIEDQYITQEEKKKIGELTYKDLLGESFEDYLDICACQVIDLLISGYKNCKPNTFIFSGRASQLAILKKKVTDHILKINKDAKEDIIKGRSNDNGLKTCVAEGALKYMNLFDQNSCHKIENKNQYAKIAVIYWREDESGIYDVKVKYLLEPNKADWSQENKIEGTVCKDFHCKITLDGIVNKSRVYYIQTFLDEDRLKKLFKPKYTNSNSNSNNLLWGFVNIIFDSIIHTNQPSIDIELEIKKDNVITKRIINANELSDTRLLENIENNIVFKNSMWPYIKDH